MCQCRQVDCSPFPLCQDVSDVLMVPYEPLALWSHLEQGPTVHTLQVYLIPQCLDYVTGGGTGVDANGLGLAVQEVEPADERMQVFDSLCVSICREQVRQSMQSVLYVGMCTEVSFKFFSSEGGLCVRAYVHSSCKPYLQPCTHTVKPLLTNSPNSENLSITDCFCGSR